MAQSPRNSSGLLFRPPITRRDWLRLMLGGAFLSVILPNWTGREVKANCSGSILERFLGEELVYRLGFWLFPGLGEARARFTGTERPGIYRATLEGRTTGIMDWLLGKYRYSYVSHMRLSAKGDRVHPLSFHLTKKHMDMEDRRSAIFDYSKKQIIFSRNLQDGTWAQEIRPIQAGRIYEDYLTLFYNFRNGCYGPHERCRTYHLPLHMHARMNSIDLSIATRQEEERQRERESIREGKDFFLRFRIDREDVASLSGEIEGWLTRDGIPIKGRIKDVVFFGDLWGELIGRKPPYPGQGGLR